MSTSSSSSDTRLQSERGLAKLRVMKGRVSAGRVLKHRAKGATAAQIRRSLRISQKDQQAAMATLKKLGLLKGAKSTPRGTQSQSPQTR